MNDEFTAARQRMVDTLNKDSQLTDPRWRTIFSEVDRHQLLREVYLPDHPEPVRATDPQWASQIYNPDGVLQVRPDTGARRYAPTPRVCARLVHGLQLKRWDPVLVVGGLTDPYLIMLLCHYLGSGLVMAVEDNRDLVARVRNATELLDLTPQLLDTPTAKVDRLQLRLPPKHLVSADPVEKVPAAWLRRVGAGGVIVAAVGSPVVAPQGGLMAGPIVRLITADGRPNGGLRADGKFLPGPAPRLGDGPHQDRPAQELGLSVVVPFPEQEGPATHHIWLGTRGKKIHSY